MKTFALTIASPAACWPSFHAVFGGGCHRRRPKQPVNFSAIAMFMIFVIATLGITKWAAGKTKSTADFYTLAAASASRTVWRCRRLHVGHRPCSA